MNDWSICYIQVDPKTPSTAKKTSFRKSTVTKPRHAQVPPAKTPLSKVSSCGQLSSTTVTKTKTATNGLPKNANSVTTTKPKPTNTVRFDPQLTMEDANFNFGGKTATMSGAKTPTVKKAAAPAMKTPKSATKSKAASGVVGSSCYVIHVLISAVCWSCDSHVMSVCS